MYDFIVLGLIPGTNVQITFELFIVLIATCGIAGVVLIEVFKHDLLNGTNRQIIKLGQNVKNLLMHWQNTLPPKLQLFK